MDTTTKLELRKLACRIRMGIIEGTFHAKSGHPGGSLSIADDLAYLYWKEMKVNPADPKWADRDRLVLSKGHCAPALYAALALKGFFPEEELQSLRHTGALLQGHPDMKHIPGVDMSTGSLGQGISAACGMALAGKMDEKDYRVYAILGDGEIEEEQELENLKTVKRREIADKIKVAISFGDLSENSEYDEAKNEQAMIESRILQIEAMLKNVKILDTGDLDTDVINVGSKVKVLDVEFEEEEIFHIVGSTEANPDAGKISDESPIGKGPCAGKSWLP